MLFKLFLLLVTVPTIEVYLLLKVGARLGAWPTFALILFTGALGAKLAHSQGLRILTDIQRELQAGRIPAGQMVDGLCVLIAGVVLVTPGFLTDALGFALLIPFFRKFFQKQISRVLGKNFRIYSPRSGSPENNETRGPGEIKTKWRVNPGSKP